MFVDKLDAAAMRNRSLVCVGLDPQLASMPVMNIAAFNKAIIEATKDLVCAYKPQIAFYEAEGLPGLHALEQTIAAIPSHIPIILDAKRGDMGNTATAYATALFERWGADAATVNPYQGTDAVEPFLAYKEKGVFILCRTSNPGSADFQDLRFTPEGPSLPVQEHPVHPVSNFIGKGYGFSAAAPMPLYEYVAQYANRWNTRGNVGLVVGATAPVEMQRIRAICPSVPILIPGIGAQGGDLEASVRAGVDKAGRRAIINSSRGIIYASKGPDYPEAARKAAMTLRDQINGVLASMGLGWS